MLFELSAVSAERGTKPVLGALDATIEEGATAIVGPSGSGKSTLLRLLNRLADPSAGEIRYRDRPIRDYDVLALRRKVALVPQLPALIAGTVADNIRFAAELDAGTPPPDIEHLLDLAGLDSSYAERDSAQLSVGEKQRAMLARALAVEPEVLLLDEPTSALDENSTNAVEEALAGLRRRTGLSIVVVTHDPAQAERLAERTITVRPLWTPASR